MCPFEVSWVVADTVPPLTVNLPAFIEGALHIYYILDQSFILQGYPTDFLSFHRSQSFLMGATPGEVRRLCCATVEMMRSLISGVIYILWLQIVYMLHSMRSNVSNYTVMRGLLLHSKPNISMLRTYIACFINLIQQLPLSFSIPITTTIIIIIIAPCANISIFLPTHTIMTITSTVTPIIVLVVLWIIWGIYFYR